jgi:tRNA-(ms[2]io[6]A)-hydroxylase
VDFRLDARRAKWTAPSGDRSFDLLFSDRGAELRKFQILAKRLLTVDAELARFYESLVESEGNHYASYLLMARELMAERRIGVSIFLELDAELMRQPNGHLILH